MDDGPPGLLNEDSCVEGSPGSSRKGDAPPAKKGKPTPAPEPPSSSEDDEEDEDEEEEEDGDVTTEDRCPGLVSDDSSSGGEGTGRRTASKKKKAKKAAKKDTAAAAAADGLQKGASTSRAPACWRLARGRGVGGRGEPALGPLCTAPSAARWCTRDAAAPG